ncbi:MAG: methionine biosynthesis protein MetW [Candidatus Poribacteria bacterium]
MNMKSDIKPDHRAIADMISNGASVLDLGCGDGELMYLLVKEKKVKAQGIDIDEQAIYKCVAKGLSVYHSDLDSGLSDYADKSFDFVILNQSLQQVRHLESVLYDSLRVGKKVIIGFPNFAYYKARFQMFFKGKAPITPALPYQWYDSPNLHFLSISDFQEYCQKKGIKIEKAKFIGKSKMIKVFPNLRANIGIFLISI